MGGLTAFAQAGIQIPVETGAAVVWYNTLSSGARDMMSFHAGCPVIFGQKRSKFFCVTVFTLDRKKVRELSANFLCVASTMLMSFIDQTHHKCSRDPDRRLEYLVNGESKYGYR